jgi:predicted nucleic acid-binding protein
VCIKSLWFSEKLKGRQDALAIELFLEQNKKEPVKVDIGEVDPEIKSARLDLGEIESIHLADEIESIHLAEKTPNSLILLDDEEARKEARKRGVKTKGTVGVLIEAYRREMIDFEELEFFLKEISKRRDIWISSELCEEVLRKVHELRK